MIPPATLRVDKGQHKIEVRKNGFAEESINANVRDGEVFNFTPSLQAIAAAGQPRKSGFLNRMFGKERIPEGKGLLILKSRPQGATVFLNGKQSTALTPL